MILIDSFIRGRNKHDDLVVLIYLLSFIDAKIFSWESLKKILYSLDDGNKCSNLGTWSVSLLRGSTDCEKELRWQLLPNIVSVFVRLELWTVIVFLIYLNHPIPFHPQLVMENFTISKHSNLWTLVKSRVSFLVSFKIGCIDIQTSHGALPLKSQTLLRWEGGSHLGASVGVTSVTGRFSFGRRRPGFPAGVCKQGFWKILQGQW